jgi:hypothetical protein
MSSEPSLYLDRKLAEGGGDGAEECISLCFIGGLRPVLRRRGQGGEPLPPFKTLHSLLRSPRVALHEIPQNRHARSDAWRIHAQRPRRKVKQKQELELRLAWASYQRLPPCSHKQIPTALVKR